MTPSLLGLWKRPSNANTIGTSFNDNFNRTSLAGAYTVNGSQITASMPGSGLNISGGNNDFLNTVDTGYKTAFELLDESITFTINTVSASSYGIGIGFNSKAQFVKNTNLAYLDCSTGSNRGKLKFVAQFDTQYTTMATSSTALTIAEGDVITMHVIQTRSSFTITATKQSDNSSISLTYSFLLNTTSTYQAHNIASVCIYLVGGSYSVSNLSLSVTALSNIKCVVFGDSISKGIGATNTRFRYLDRVFNSDYTQFTVLSGSGCVSGDFLSILGEVQSIQAQYALINLGENDANFGVSTSTYSSNMHAIVNSLIEVGTIPIFTTIVPNDNVDVNPYINIINSQFSTYTRCDIYSALVEGGNTRMDRRFFFNNPHPNDAGHQAIANVITSTATQLSSYNPLNTYVSVANSAGVNFNSTQNSALLNFYNGLKANYLDSKFFTLYLHCLGGASQLVRGLNFFNAADTNASFRGTFPNGVSLNNGVQGNGTNQYMRTYFDLTQQEGVNTNGVGLFLYTPDQETNKRAMGANGGFRVILENSGIDVYAISGPTVTGTPFSSRTGLTLAYRSDTSNIKVFRNGALSRTITSANNLNLASGELYMLAENGGGTGTTTVQGYSGLRFYISGVCKDFTDTDAVTFNTLISSLITDLGL